MSFQQYKKRFIEIAGSRSVNNDMINSFMFIVLAGALCHKRGITVDRGGIKDLRIHAMLIQPSRTGKGESLKVLRKACEFSGLRYIDETQFTDAGLVGQVDASIANNNRKKGLTPQDPEYVDPITIGDLGIYDVISFSEGKQMIKLGTYSDDKLEILQGIMDTPGRIRKKLSNEIPIEISSSASLVGTTYFLEDFEKIFLQQGIFQRMLVSVREFNIDDRRELNRMLIFDEPAIKSQDFDNELQRFCIDLGGTIDKVPKDTVLVFDDSGKKALGTRVTDWMDLIVRDFRGNELKIIDSYTTALINLYSKLAAVAAILNGSDVITSKEVGDAHPYIRYYMNSILNEVLMKITGVDDSKLKRMLVNHIKKSTKLNNRGRAIDGVLMVDLIDLIQDKFHDISEARIQKIIKDLIKSKVLEEIMVTVKSPVTGKDQKMKKFAMRGRR